MHAFLPLMLRHTAMTQLPLQLHARANGSSPATTARYAAAGCALPAAAPTPALVAAPLPGRMGYWPRGVLRHSSSRLARRLLGCRSSQRPFVFSWPYGYTDTCKKCVP